MMLKNRCAARGDRDPWSRETALPVSCRGAESQLIPAGLAGSDVDRAVALMERIPFPVLRVGPGYRVRWLNQAGRTAYGGSEGTCFALSHGYSEPCWTQGEACPMQAAEETATAVSVEHVHRTADGFSLYKVTAIPIEGEGVLVLQVPMAKSSVADSLTGVYSRHCFELLAARELALLRRMDRPCTLVLADLDALKAINDARGHAAGDAALLAFARALTGAVRTTDTVGRLGGDEFCLFLPATGGVKALALVKRVRRAVRAASLPDPFREVRLSASFGLHTAAPGESFDGALAEADRALYLAKSGGRDRIEIR